MSDDKRCQEQHVTDRGGWHTHPCSRKAWKDGWCKQHHPETIAARREAQRERYEAKEAASPWRKLEQANKCIAELERRWNDLVEVQRQADKLMKAAWGKGDQTTLLPPS